MSILWNILIMATLLPLSIAEGEHSSQPLVETVTEIIDTKTLRHEPEYGYVATLRMDRPGDSEGQSSCVLYEDDKPLALASSLHADIREMGLGRYSHWSRHSLYFSASDNSDPRTNGRQYTLKSLRRTTRHTHEFRVSEAEAAYQIPAPDDRAIVNRRVVLRNIDEQITVIPTFKVKGWPDLTTIDGMLKSTIRSSMSEEEKAIAIWKFLRDWRYHFYPAEGGDEIHDPVKFLNVYGYGFCDDSARNFAVLCRAAGMRARVWGISGHVIGEAFYDGGWHMLDPDVMVYYRMPEGYIASVEELAAHPEVITNPSEHLAEELGTTIETLIRAASYAKFYVSTEDNRAWEGEYQGGHTLMPKLAPGDELVFDLDAPEKVRRILFTDKPMPPVAGNGRLVRQIDLTDAKDKSVIDFEWPYVLVGGELQFSVDSPEAKIDVEIRCHNDEYETLDVVSEGHERIARLDKWLDGKPNAVYNYSIRLSSYDGQLLKEIIRRASLTTVFQFAPRVIPQVAPGGTTFQWLVRPLDGKPTLPIEWLGIEVIHEWDEVLEESAPKLQY